MLRLFLIAAVLGLACGADTAHAQNAQNCQSFCQSNRCKGGLQTAQCINNCVAACQQKMSKSKK